jgi:hypothetical protein
VPSKILKKVAGQKVPLAMWLSLRWRTTNTYYFIEVTGDETVADLKQLLLARYDLEVAVVAFQNASLTNERLNDIPGLGHMARLRIEPAAGAVLPPAMLELQARTQERAKAAAQAAAPAPAAAAKSANPPPPSVKAAAAANPPPPAAAAARPPPPTAAAAAPAAAARPPPVVAAPAAAAARPAAPTITMGAENAAAQAAFDAFNATQKADIAALQAAYPQVHRTVVIATYVASEHNQAAAAKILSQG